MHQIQGKYFQAHYSNIHNFNHLELVAHSIRYVMFACMQVSTSLSITCNVYVYSDLYGASRYRPKKLGIRPS